MTAPSTPSGSPDPRERRLARLRLARELHPDHGGDHDAYVAAMAALDAADAADGDGSRGDEGPAGGGSSYGGSDRAEVVLVARRGWRWPRRLRRRVRDYRRRNWARL